MIDVVSFDSYPSERTKRQMKHGFEQLTKARDEEHRAHFGEWLLSAVYDKEKLAGGRLDTYLDYISGPVGQPSLFQHQIRHYDSKHTMAVADRYHELGAMPVKLIWGANDTWQVPQWARKLHEAIPGSELSIIKECGHFSPEDQPEQVAELIVEFFKKIESHSLA